MGLLFLAARLTKIVRNNEQYIWPLLSRHRAFAAEETDRGQQQQRKSEFHDLRHPHVILHAVELTCAQDCVSRKALAAGSSSHQDRRLAPCRSLNLNSDRAGLKQLCLSTRLVEFRTSNAWSCG